LVVVAPHPDDEALMAGGAIAGAVARGEPVAVLVLTSGDFDCRSAASTRQAESVAALAALGVREDQIFFLGYPDGYLSRLGVAPLPAVPRLIDGVCVRGNTTYGQRGAGRADVHTARAGAPAEYTAPNLVADLRYLLERLAPRRLIVTHPADTHPDHAAAYAFVRRALAGSHRPPRLLRALVHGDDCWPTSSKPGPDCAPGRIAPSEAMPLPSGVLRGYLPNLRLAVPSSCLRPEADKNPKLAAIAAYTSQTRGSSSSYLFAFARREELFFTEDLPTRIEPRVDNELRFSMRGHERFRVEQRVPLDLSVTLERPAPGKPMRVSLLDTGNERYVLDFDGAALQVSLSIQSGGGLIALKQWPLPHDAWATAERFELQVARDPADASAAALTLLRNDVIVGVAIDPDPPSRGGSVSVVDPSGSREGVRLSLTRR
jgi:LmbE family N-acetylglucosaminyl deacetylase